MAAPAIKKRKLSHVNGPPGAAPSRAGRCMPRMACWASMFVRIPHRNLRLSYMIHSHVSTWLSSPRREALEAERRQLPVWTARDALLAEVRAARALIVVGETGSGKTTQIPRMLMEAGLARGCMVACTQPRRVAAITVARRVAEEMGVAIGGTVGSRPNSRVVSCRGPADVTMHIAA